MKAAVWYGEKDIRIEERKLKEVGPNEVKVKVGWTGICGSDLHAYLHPESVPVDKNTVLGHEFSGVVEEVGSNSSFKVGDRVAIFPMVLKGEVDSDIERFHVLNNESVGANMDGGFAEYAVVPEKSLVKIPDNLSLDLAALVEPAAVSYQAIKDSDIKSGDTVVVFGAGPIGLFSIAAAKAAGAKNVIAVDIFEDRLNKATEMGATHILNSKDVNPVEEIRKLFPDGVDVAVEAAGVEQTFNQAIQSTKIRGTMMVVSFHTEEIQFNAPASLLFGGVKLMGSNGYTYETYDEVIELLASGKLSGQSVITSKIKLEDIVEKGFEELLVNKSQSKILVSASNDQ